MGANPDHGAAVIGPARDGRHGAGHAAAVSFHRRVHDALADARLQGAVRTGTERLSGAYGQAAAATPEFAELRHRAAEIRARTLRSLDRHLETLAATMERNGGHVYFAADAAAACAYILELARRHGVRRVVKSKSMISEEIGLNHALEAQGVHTLETDLGEYIVQQAGEMPAHIVIPALHKTVDQVAGLFSTVVGRDLPAEPPQLAAMARSVLREGFLAADMGISGVNFAVAESGTLAIVSNEGNVDLCTTLPRVHVALMGMERLVPSWDDLPPLLRILPMAGTGQRITTYITLLSGPRRADEPDGPEESHLIILDNGRASILGTEFADVLRCIRCGACLNVCPIYRNIGGHAYGSVYPGPIGAVLSPLLVGDAARTLPYASSLCGACTEACPVEIPLHDLLIKHRQRDVAEGRAPAAERLAFRLLAEAWRRPGTFRWSGLIGSRALQLMAGMPVVGGGDGWLSRLPGPGAGWTAERDFPAPRGKPFHERWARLAREAATGTEGGAGLPQGGPPGGGDAGELAQRAFLARVRLSLAKNGRRRSPDGGHGPAPAAIPAGEETADGVVAVDPRDLAQRFIEEIARVAGSAEVVSSPEVAVSAVAAALAGAGAASAVLSADVPLASAALAVALAGRGITCYQWSDPTGVEVAASWRQTNATAAAGVTGAAWAIAATGTVALVPGGGAGRLPGLLPPVHVAVVPLSRLVPDLAAVCRLLGQRGRAFALPSGAILVTGPSRSSDIGGAIVRGVHGPGRVHVVLVDDTPG